MNEKQFYNIRDRFNRGDSIWIGLQSGKYSRSVCRVLDTKTHTTYYDDLQNFKYKEHKIKVKINNRIIWQSAWSLYESTQTHETIVTKSLRDQRKQPPKDFLEREFNVDDVVFLHSPTYGEILGVIEKINEKGTLTIRVAKKTNEHWSSEHSKQGIFMVPYDRTNRILIIDDPAILLLRA